MLHFLKEQRVDLLDLRRFHLLSDVAVGSFVSLQDHEEAEHEDCIVALSPNDGGIVEQR